MEFNFQTISIIVAVILLLIILGTLAYTISSSKKSGTIPWPPVVGTCPDYWTDLSGNGSQCIGTIGHNVGSLTSLVKPIDFTNATSVQIQGNGVTYWPSSYSGSDPLCAKRMWAHNAGNISWDGVTYGISQPSGCTV